MSARAPRRHLGGLVLLAAALGACKRDEPAPPAPVAVEGVDAASSTPPPDHLAPGELVEGKEQAFGLVLPRDVRVLRTIDKTIYASATVRPDSLMKYVRARTTAGKVVREDDGYVFTHVKPRSGDRELEVRIVPAFDACRLEIRDITPPPPQQLPDEAARWRAAGMKPNGELLDPLKMQ